MDKNIFKLKNKENSIVNEIKNKTILNTTVNSTLLEMPFEWEITLANGLWWKMDKQIHDHEFEIPDYLKVDPKNIILLEE